MSGTNLKTFATFKDHMMDFKSLRTNLKAIDTFMDQLNYLPLKKTNSFLSILPAPCINSHRPEPYLKPNKDIPFTNFLIPSQDVY